MGIFFFNFTVCEQRAKDTVLPTIKKCTHITVWTSLKLTCIFSYLTNSTIYTSHTHTVLLFCFQHFNWSFVTQTYHKLRWHCCRCWLGVIQQDVSLWDRRGERGGGAQCFGVCVCDRGEVCGWDWQDHTSNGYRSHSAQFNYVLSKLLLLH